MLFDKVVQKLQSKKFFLKSLPTLYSRDFYLVYEQGTYYQFYFNKKYQSISGFKSYNNAAFEKLYNLVTEKYQFEDRHFSRRSYFPIPEFSSKIKKAFQILLRLATEPYCVMDKWLVTKDAYLGYLAITFTKEGKPYQATFPENRVIGEILTSLLKGRCNPDVETEEALQASQKQINKYFKVGYPSTSEMVITKDEKELVGFWRNTNDYFVQVKISKDTKQVLSYLKIPTKIFYETFCKFIFKAPQPLLYSLEVSDDLKQSLIQCENVDYIFQLRRDRKCETSMGEHRSNQYVDDGDQLISPVLGKTYDFKTIIQKCINNDFFYHVLFKTVESNTDKYIKVVDNRISYTIPLKWAGKFSKERRIEKVMLAVFYELTGIDISENREEQIKEGKRVVLFGDKKVGMRITCDPIESGIGIHGSTCSYSFNGLPEDIKLSGYSTLSVRTGGKVNLEVDGPKGVLETLRDIVVDEFGR